MTDNASLGKAVLAEPLAVSWHAVRLALEALPKGRDIRTPAIGGSAFGLAGTLAFGAMDVSDIQLSRRTKPTVLFLWTRVSKTLSSQTMRPMN
ncbi:hypothetical protein [Sedimentitalea nanhaiensis]|uniref:Uncharacterized protein n=1 Tax=Sedimentitalea nanhaiensis TaxID=999627 RepID=A0A1I7E9K9_9RHOB|nr:hypothetical protein [Sedimentitalea nanhaiensis]SFU20565.1 hypothetical protein SAMN05216236_15219 [Sedimentitalea nanhaiensis]